VLPWVGIAPPYHFTENVAQIGNWLVPAVVLGSGIALHALVTKRLPLCLAWFGGFLAQAFLRAWVFNLSLLPLLVPISGVAFILFTLYMIPDPATTPLALKRQVIFGLTVATAYGSLQCLHVVYGLFFSLVLVCGLRGILICLIGCQARIRRAGPVAAPHPIYVARQ
jgi:enediyne biosynthesis protein E5